jgi:hypothetical protein
MSRIANGSPGLSSGYRFRLSLRQTGARIARPRARVHQFVIRRLLAERACFEE